MSLVCEARKATVEETIFEYTTKSHIRSNANNIALNLKRLYSLVQLLSTLTDF